MQKSNILITGGAGFIGSHLGEKLASADQQIFLLDRFKSSPHRKRKEKNIASFIKNKKVIIIDEDILAKEKINKIFKKNPINSVVHLAAQADVSRSISQPEKTIKTNLIGSSIIFEAAAKHGVSRIIYASSSLVYGKANTLPMAEDMPCNYPTSPYAVSMRAIELAAYAHYLQYKIPIIGLRFFPIYGPRMRENLVIPVLTKKISQNKPVTILGDGQQMRSYCYIDDIVEAITAAIKNSDKLAGYQIINLGHPTPITLIDLIALIEKILDKKAQIRYQPARREDIPLLYPDLSKAKRLLDWQPKIALEKGLKRYINWLKNSQLSKSS